MKITRHGRTAKQFICHFCNCEFIAGSKEYKLVKNGEYVEATSFCPECGNVTRMRDNKQNN